MPNSDDAAEGLGAAEAFDHLAGECLVHGRRDEAVEYHRRALAVRERLLGPDHWEVANSLMVLAGVVGWKRFEGPEVEALTRRSADIYERLVSHLAAERGEEFDHAFQGLLGALSNLALLALNRGDLDGAEAGYRRVHGMVGERYGPDRRHIHPSLTAFAHLLVRRGKGDEAEGLLRAALARAGGPEAGDDWGVADCEEALAELCAGLGRGAEGLYRSAVARRERIARDGWPASAGAAAHTLRGLARLCRRAGRAEEADELERRAVEWARRRAEAMPWEGDDGEEAEGER